MKDNSKQDFETTRPDKNTVSAIQGCLNKFYKNKKKSRFDKICKGVTYEDVIGALLLGRDAAKELERRDLNPTEIPCSD